MLYRFFILRLLWGLSLCSMFACQTAPPAATTAPAQRTEAPVSVDRSSLSLFAVLPSGAVEAPSQNLTPQRIALGRMLYFDTRLSKNHDVSCNSCHELTKYGVDGRAVSQGHRQQMGLRNAPSVYNAAGHFVQFWDGRSPSVEHQATQPLQNAKEMAMTEAKVVQTLRSIPGYVSFFKQVFPQEAQPIRLVNVGLAIGAFERTLLTPAAWDKFLAGDDGALSKAQKRGLNTFVQSGCIACHNGAYVGGSMYQKVGLVQAWPHQQDLGRAAITHQDSDKMMFKVPSLRNVAHTAPYFHDGSTASLSEAVRMMGHYQLGKELSQAAIADIVSWLESLSGALPAADSIAKPVLPASGPHTPPADPT